MPLIESGTHTPHVSVDAFDLPENTALRLERPDPRLTALVTDYHVLDSVENRPGKVDWMLPSWAAIRIFLGSSSIGVTLGNRTYDPVPVASLYGVTSRAMRVATQGGVTVGLTITPLGWARLFSQRADLLRDRITPLDTLMPPDRVAALVDRLRASDLGGEVRGILDEFLLEWTATPNPDEPLIARIMELVLDDGLARLGESALLQDVTENRLRRVTNRYFGFAPKTLMLRSRFLRSFVRMMATRDKADYSQVAAVYHDRSHFLRDARRFLGMTPRAFMAMDTPYLDAAMRARRAVFGQPVSSLQRPAE